MFIRNAEVADLLEILKIYDIARSYMRENGNHSQWINGYPSEELLREDIANKQLYVVEEEGVLYGVFAFILGEDPTYKNIEGSWLNSNNYGTIHRIASSGQKSGIMKLSIAYCKEQIEDLKIDTHADNKPMQQLILNNGFSYCGIIYVADGSPRLAYQIEFNN